MRYSITFQYKKNSNLFNDFCIEIPENKITAICGHNGAGKTTLLKCLAGILPCNLQKTSGWYVSSNGGLIQHFSLKEHLSILGLKNEKDVLQNSLVNEAYNLFNAREFENNSISRLSTGQGMMCAIITAFASNNSFLLLDECFGCLDPTNAESLSKLLKKAIENGKTVLFTAHDLYLTKETADYINFIKNGKIAYQCDNREEITIDELKVKYREYA